MSNRPLILVSNDDSIAAPGVHVLIDRLVAYGDVIAVCPDDPQSGQSMALTVNKPLHIKVHPDYNGAKVYSVTGTPVDCIKLAMHHILPRTPDLVVAGINHGSNASVNVLYSGTMGATMEGCAFGIPSVGFSLTDHAMDADFTPCLKAIDSLIPDVLQNGLPQGICLNVNIPDIAGTPREMRLCRPCRGNWNDEYKKYLDPHGVPFYWLTGTFKNLEPDNEETDEWALAHGLVSVVPVAIDRSSCGCVKVDWLEQTVKAYNRN